MIDNLPAAPDPASDTPTVFNQKAAALVLAMVGMVPQINATTASLSALAAGGAFAIPYVWGQANVAGKMATSAAASASAATGFDIHKFSANGLDVSVILQQFDQSTSLNKGRMRVVKVSDPAAQLVFNLASRTDNGTYVHFDGAMVFASSANPFTTGDLVMLYFDRTGDKGDSSATTPILWVRDAKTSGSGGGTSASAATVRRNHNSVLANTVSGASVSSDLISLPAGRYRFRGSYPAYNVGYHRASLRVSGATSSLVDGTTEYASGSVSRSVLSGEIYLTSAQTLEVIHLTQNSVTNGLGVPSGSPPEIYGEIFFEKVA